jgi:hypothetical protein
MLYQLSYASTGCRSSILKTGFQRLPAARDKVQRLSQRNLACKRLLDRDFQRFRTGSNRPTLTAQIGLHAQAQHIWLLLNSTQNRLAPLLLTGICWFSQVFFPNLACFAPAISEMRRRKLVLIPLLIVLAVAAAIAAAVFLRKAAPPEPARLLPTAEGYVYVDLSPLRKAGLLDKLPPIVPEGDYKEFIEQTGFQFEHDLEEAAFAIHAKGGKDAAGKPENRYSEVFVADFDSQRVANYLRKLSSSVDSYRNREIFNVPRENRVVRICLLGPDLAAISNLDDPYVIRGIIDRYGKLASPFGGPRLLRRYYRRVPLASLAWGILNVAPSSEKNSPYILPGGFDLSFPPDTVSVVSIRYLGSINLKAQAFTNSEEGANHVAEQLNSFLNIFRSLEANASGGDPDVKTFFDSIEVKANHNEAVLNAELPKGFLKKILAEPPSTPIMPEATAPPPAAPQKKSGKSKRP